MTPLKPFYIGPVGDGLRRDLKPISIPEEAFSTLEDMYIFRGRAKRRVGYSLLGRLSHYINGESIGNITGASTTTLNLFTVLSITESGRNVVPGTLEIVIAAPGSYTITESSEFPGKLVSSPSAGFDGGFIDYTNGDISLTFSAVFAASAATVTFFWAVNRPSMGLPTRELPEINAEDAIGFDTKFSYRYSNSLGSYERLPSTMDTTWTGTDSDFFYSQNYQRSFWTTNNTAGMHFFTITNVVAGATTDITAAGNNFQVGDWVFVNEVVGIEDADGNSVINGQSGQVTIAGDPTFTTDIDTSTATTGYTSGGIVQSLTRQVTGGGDGIRYHEGTTWVNFAPPISANLYLKGALIIIPYKGYYLALNTLEGTSASTTRYSNRARYSQIGTAYYSDPRPAEEGVEPLSWRDDVFGRGGAIDAPTSEQITGAEFVRDILVVYFERSTWKLRFTQNSILPFVWERVNRELGAESTFSLIPFDDGIRAVGSRGFVSSDGNSTIRIDNKIPDLVFDIENDTNGVKRVHGIRTYPSKLVYWTYPNSQDQLVYPNKMVVWNYEQNTWAIFNDSFTCFGYWQSFNDLTWENAHFTWESAHFTWSSGILQSLYENIVGGNQQGFVETMETKIGNDPSLVISDITTPALPDPCVITSTNHNIADESWIELSGIAGILNADGTSLNNRSYKVSIIDNDTFVIFEFEPFPLGTISATETEFEGTIDSPWTPFLKYSVEVSLVDTVTGFIVTLKDNAGDEVLSSSTAGYSGTVNYVTGALTLDFPALANDTTAIARVIGDQTLVPVSAIEDITLAGGVAFDPPGYYGGGYITRINSINAKTKFFNFFPGGQKARVSKIDFYTNTSEYGQFTANIFGDSNETTALNKPFPGITTDIVLTSQAPNLIPDGSQTIYRLFCETTAQTYQLGLSLSDKQLANRVIRNTNIEIPAFIYWARPSGRVF